MWRLRAPEDLEPLVVAERAPLLQDDRDPLRGVDRAPAADADDAVGPALATVPYVLGGAVLLEASLSFLGLGTPPPAASWGRALADARESLTAAWWCVVQPALALFLLVLSARKVGEAVSESR